MANVLVCVKRVPEASGQILLTDDEQSVDARHVGWTVSAHEEAAVELATQVAAATGGSATVVTVGSSDAVEQLRNALAVGCDSAVLVEADTTAYGPADVAVAIADVVRAHEADGNAYDLVLLGNDAADTGDFQVGIRLASTLGRPVVTGISTCAVADGVVVARGEGPDGTEVFELPLPAVVAVMEGGVAPRYPSIPGRMKAKRAPIETVVPQRVPTGSGRVRWKLPPPQPSSVEILGTGPEAAPAVVDLLERLGVVSR
ncbi:MAG: electron transfer flavoprotein subunit beta/FixA family protein [Actinomycetota bacterium]|nr:electron transfer flavoprotein subunit beta/FixA family protein [Actinomycetota bacterium]